MQMQDANSRGKTQSNRTHTATIYNSPRRMIEGGAIKPPAVPQSEKGANDLRRKGDTKRKKQKTNPYVTLEKHQR